MRKTKVKDNTTYYTVTIESSKGRKRTVKNCIRINDTFFRQYWYKTDGQANRDDAGPVSHDPEDLGFDYIPVEEDGWTICKLEKQTAWIR